MESSVGPIEPPDAVRGPAAIDQRDRTIAVVASLLLLICMPIGYIGGKTTTGDVVGLIVMTLLSLAIMAAVFLALVPRERAAGRASRTSLILGVAAIVLSVVFWTGLPFPIGAGAIALGLSARESAGTTGSDGRATVAVVLGTIAVVGSFVVMIIG